MKRTAIIYRPSKTAMQSGIANTKQWRLLINSDGEKPIDPTMGWVGGNDTTRQLKMKFDNVEDAIKYCENNSLSYDIESDNERVAPPKSYANNFSTEKRTYFDVVAANKIDL